MAIDGIFLNNLSKELNSAVGSRVDKISQPSRDEFILSLRGISFSKKLLLCARSGSARVHFTEAEYENPAVPPMLCMLMRKHLLGGKILSVSQDGFERVLTISLLCTNEMGEKQTLRLIAELIGNQANVILVGADGKILDAARRSDIETSARLIQPGAIYYPPDSLEKLPPDDSRVFNTIIENRGMLTEAILESVQGVSPLIAREIAHKICDDKHTSELNDSEKSLLKDELENLKKASQNGEPYILYDMEDLPRDFSYMPISQYDGIYTLKKCNSFSAMLDTFYAERDRIGRLRHSANDVYKTLSNAAARAEKKLHLRKRELARCAERENMRICGELIKANIALIERGADSATVPNYYDENLAPITIKLDPALSPAANGAKYFKEYRKLCSAEQMLSTLIAENEQEIVYLASVKDALERATSLSEILDIKDELILSGYIRCQKGKPQKRQKARPLEFKTDDGYTVLVGRNNLQNDELTLKTANKDDIWLHTKNIHGSHVIIRCEGTVPPNSTVLRAAELAAYYSQARNSSQVPVDYTAIKNVKKPSGARPGMVIYKTNSTVFVTPKE